MHRDNSRKLVGVVLAGGIGTRLFGPTGGSKALFDLNGNPLIHYSLSAFDQARIREIAIVVRMKDEKLQSRYPSCEQIIEESVGTLAAVMAAGNYARQKGADVIISSCDLVCSPSSAKALIDASLANMNWVAAFGVTTIANDHSPIWVHSDASGQIVDYGKAIKPSRTAFASIRFATLEFLDLMSEIGSSVSADIDTDTKLMRHLCVNKKLVAGVVDIGPALDVDDEVDVRIATELSHSFRT